MPSETKGEKTAGKGDVYKRQVFAVIDAGVPGGHHQNGPLSYLEAEGLGDAGGGARIDNGKYKHFFGVKAKMLTPEEAVERIGHAVGGVDVYKRQISVPALRNITPTSPAPGQRNPS